MERTFVMLKPDAHARKLVGEIIARFEKKGFLLAGMRMLRLSRPQVMALYQDHVGQPWFDEHVAFIMSGYVVPMCWAGPEVVQTVRRMIGATNGRVASQNSIRGDMSISGRKNLIHASDGPKSALHELSLFFNDADLAVSENGWTHHSDEHALASVDYTNVT